MMLSEQLRRNKKLFAFAMISVFAWGLFAHGYGFLHANFSGDSLSEFYGKMGSNAWKIQLGRYVVPAYKAVFRTDMTLPWMVGLLSLIWFGLAVCMIVQIFGLESKLLIFLTAGIFTTNITVSATAASYMHDYDCNMFALMCATAAVYLWREYRWGVPAGAVLTAMSMGIYQSYVSVTVVLVMFVCILDLLNETGFRVVMCNGLKAIAMLILGGAAYYAGMHLVLHITGIPMHSGDTNSLDAVLTLTPRSVLGLTFGAYLDCLRRLLHADSPYPGWMIQSFTVAQILVVAAAFLTGLRNKKVKLPEKLLCLVLAALLPFGMHMIYVLTSGIVHDLMVYPIWLFYLLVLLMTDWLIKYARKHACADRGPVLTGWLCAGMIFVILYGNVQTANALYLKKDMEQDAYLALMNRIVYRMETLDDYEAGETPVVFVGSHQLLNKVIPGYEEYLGITGMSSSEVANPQEDYRLRTYFQMVMNYPVNVPGSDVFQRMREDSRVAEMPAYPEDGSVAVLDGILVVKLG